MITIDGIGQRYSKRPSELIGITDKKIALDFDIAVALKGSMMEKEQMEKARNKSKEEKPFSPERFKQQFNSVKALQNRVKGMNRGK